MKINFTYRIISLTLAFLMLFSSIGVSKDMHWCQGKVQAISFVGKAKSCNMMDEVPTNCEMKSNKAPVVTKEPCCHNETEFKQFKADYGTPSFDDLSTQNVQFLVAYSFTYVLHHPNVFSNSDIIRNEHYQSPEISRDIYVLLETYLI